MNLLAADSSVSSSEECFRRLFQRSMRNCIKKGFAVEECFGIIWGETSEEVNLSEAESGRIYQDLLAWTNDLIKSSRSTN